MIAELRLLRLRAGDVVVIRGPDELTARVVRELGRLQSAGLLPGPLLAMVLPDGVTIEQVDPPPAWLAAMGERCEL